MNTKWIIRAILAASIVVGAGTVAHADEKDQGQSSSRESKLRPAKHNLELTLGTGYAQGVGNVGSSQPSLTDIGTAGGAVQLGVGYRLIPQLTLGVYGSGAMFGRGDQVDPSANLYSATAGVQAEWHFLPGGHQFDPWFSTGSGWRGYWSHTDQGTTALHGLELVRLQVGLDYRLTESVAISPVIGADLSTFVTQSTPTSTGFSNVATPYVNTFVFAGLQGRFDIPTGSDASTHMALR